MGKAFFWGGCEGVRRVSDGAPRCGARAPPSWGGGEGDWDFEGRQLRRFSLPHKRTLEWATPIWGGPPGRPQFRVGHPAGHS